MKTEKFISFDEGDYKRFCAPQQIERDINNLHGLLCGMNADGKFEEMEINQLRKWIIDAEHLERKYPYAEILPFLAKVIEDGVITNEEFEDLIWLLESYTNRDSKYYTEITSGIQRLHGILSGIIADEIINQEEIIYLKEWINENDYLKNTYPYQDILELVTEILKDNVISIEEYQELKNLCITITNGHESIIQSSNKSIIETGNSVIFEEKTFCITGTSPNFTRKQISDMIELYGGYMMDSISKKLNYLVICSEKNNCWAFSSYGRKIEKVMALQKAGAEIQVIHENDVYHSIELLKSI